MEVYSTFDEEGEGLTWDQFSCGEGPLSNTKGVVGITILENNHIGNPIFHSGRLKVSMKGGPIAPQGGETNDIP